MPITVHRFICICRGRLAISQCRITILIGHEHVLVRIEPSHFQRQAVLHGKREIRDILIGTPPRKIYRPAYATRHSMRKRKIITVCPSLSTRTTTTGRTGSRWVATRDAGPHIWAFRGVIGIDGRRIKLCKCKKEHKIDQRFNSLATPVFGHDDTLHVE